MLISSYIFMYEKNKIGGNLKNRDFLLQILAICAEFTFIFHSIAQKRLVFTQKCRRKIKKFQFPPILQKVELKNIGGKLKKMRFPPIFR